MPSPEVSPAGASREPEQQAEQAVQTSEPAQVTPVVAPSAPGGDTPLAAEARQEEIPAPATPASASEFVYPPPPSFYENLPPDASRFRPPVAAAPASRGPSQERQSAEAWGTSFGTAPRPTFAPLTPSGPAAPPFPPGTPPAIPPAQRQSRRWLWITLSIFAIALVASLGFCGWGVYRLLDNFQHQYSGAVSLIQDYYDDIQRQDYTHAFNDLQLSGLQAGLTREQFIQQAQTLDQQYGPVISYSIGAFTPNITQNEATPNSYSVQVQVTRTHQSYNVFLTVQQIGGRWKITDFDRI